MGEGGLARLRVKGQAAEVKPDGSIPSINLLQGARVFHASDASYGDPSLALREEREGKYSNQFILKNNIW